MTSENLFNTGRERKKDFERKLLRSRMESAFGRAWTYFNYGLRDSALEGGLGSFSGSFFTCLPEGETDLKNYIEKILYNKKGKAIAIELGGPGSKLFASFTPDFFKRTAGFTLVNPQFRKKTRDADALRNHSVIQINLLDESSVESASQWLHGEKADLIFERLVKGFHNIPKEPYFLAKRLQQWYSMLNEGGVMFLQVPGEINVLIGPWVEHVKNTCPQSLDVQAHLGHSDYSSSYGISAVRIQKKIGAPERLPMLDNFEIRKIVRENK